MEEAKMKITSEHIGRLLEARLERIHRASQPPRQFSIDQRDPDRVSFSARADDLRAALAAARAADDVADPAVEALRADVAAGRYQPPARAVADSMLRDLMG
jgi:flagellar biosynthesis anti-sigma factor FlgM